MALRSIVYCDMFGVERLTSIYGIMSAMMGFGILLGTPTLGMLKELTGSYTWTFIASGSFLIASGICHSILPIVRKWEEEILNRNIE